MRGSTTASRMPMAITPPEYPTGPPISGSDSRASRVARHSGELDGGCGEALRCGVPGSGRQSGVHHVQSAGVAGQDVRELFIESIFRAFLLILL